MMEILGGQSHLECQEGFLRHPLGFRRPLVPCQRHEGLRCPAVQEQSAGGGHESEVEEGLARHALRLGGAAQQRNQRGHRTYTGKKN